MMELVFTGSNTVAMSYTWILNTWNMASVAGVSKVLILIKYKFKKPHVASGYPDGLSRVGRWIELIYTSMKSPLLGQEGAKFIWFGEVLMTWAATCFNSAATHNDLRYSEVLVKITETHWKGNCIFFVKIMQVRRCDLWAISLDAALIRKGWILVRWMIGFRIQDMLQ